MVAGFGLGIVAMGRLADAAPLGTDFTYQGQLKQGGLPVNVPVDLEFSLWDQALVGVQIGLTQTKLNVDVSNGLFAVDLNFGAGAFAGEARWLQIAVRRPAGIDPYVPLTTRQYITPTPYALGLRLPLSQTVTTGSDAINVTNAGTGDCAQFNITDPSNVGEAVEGRTAGSGGAIQGINTGAGRAGFFQISNAGNGSAALYATTNGTGPALVADGSVGIGTSAPARKLQVGSTAISNSEGMIRLASRSGTQGSSRVWDIGVPETDADTSGPGYSFVIDDIAAGGGPEIMVKYGSGNVGIGNIVDPGQLLDVGGRMRVRQGGGTAGIWFYQTTPAADRAFVGMYDDDTFGLYGNTGAGWSLLLDTTTGDVGIGTSNPQAPLHIVSNSDAEPSGGGILVLGSTSGGNIALDGNEIMARNNGATSPLYLNNDGGNVHMAVVAGGVSIGTTTIPTGVLLAVDGKVLCEEMEVQLSGDWPDYVFADDYALLPLSELEQSVEQNGHLPGIPSAADVAKNGVNVGKMQAQLLEKVEELTLYMIQMNKQMDRVEQENSELKARLAALEGGR